MKTPQQILDIIWRSVALALLLCAVAALAGLLAQPSQAENAVWGGFSIERLLLAGLVAVPGLAVLWMLVRGRGMQSRRQAALAWLGAQPAGLAIVAGVAGLGLLGLAWLPLERLIAFFGSWALYLQRLQPVFGYLVTWIAAGLVLWAAAQRPDWAAWQPARSLVRSSLWVCLALVLVIVIILTTRVGLGQDATRWAAPNAPILLTQCVLALGLAIALLAASARLQLRRGDVALAALVWLLAAAAWTLQPAQPTYYNSVPAAPNYESYPLSDAFNHDVIAQNVQIGEGFRFGGTVAIRRPLYVMFLAAAESVLPSYAQVIQLQVLLLALFPALLYLLASRMHHRLSGLLLAGLMIFRESNAIALGDVINLSHAKLLMADLPAALGITLVAVLALRWLSLPAPDGRRALVLGGVLGAFILLRSQMLTVVPVFAVLALLVWGLRRSWRAVLLFGLGVLLVAAPWVLRNRLEMGQWAIEDSVVSGFLANRYRYEAGTFGLPFLEGESEGEYYARQMGAVRDFIRQDPGFVAGFVIDNFARNQLINFMTLPTSHVLRELESHVRTLPYWPSWDGHLATESWPVVALNLILVSIGLAASWQRLRWAGLVPLFINLGFTANLALARVAGWRYNLPADWTVLVYYAIGIGQVCLWLAALWPRRAWLAAPDAPRPAAPAPSTARAWLLTLLALGLAGCSYSLIEAFSQPRYSKLSTAQVISQVQALPDAPAALLTLLEEGKLDILNGRALYPSFFAAGEGETLGFALTEVQTFPRLSFYLIGPQPMPVLLPLADSPLQFPHASDAIVLRCSSHAPSALAVILPQYGTIVPSSHFADGCPEIE